MRVSGEALEAILETQVAPQRLVEHSCKAPGTLLAGSWEALGRVLEASKKQHEPKTGKVAILNGFLEK